MCSCIVLKCTFCCRVLESAQEEKLMTKQRDGAWCWEWSCVQSMRRRWWVGDMAPNPQTSLVPSQKDHPGLVGGMSFLQSSHHLDSDGTKCFSHYVQHDQQLRARGNQTSLGVSHTGGDHRCVWRCWRTPTRLGSYKDHNHNGMDLLLVHRPSVDWELWMWPGQCAQVCWMISQCCWGLGTPRMHCWQLLRWGCAAGRGIACGRVLSSYLQLGSSTCCSPAEGPE